MPKKSIINPDTVAVNAVRGVPNPTIYDDKLPTNIRIEKWLKERLIKDAEDNRCAISDIVNDALRAYYKK